MGIESSPAFGYIFIYGNRKARSRGDRAERVGSGRSRRREGSRGDRSWVVREGRGSAARCPFQPGTVPHPARRAGTQAARAARASPRTKGPAPETGRGRGEADPASQAAARGRGGRAPPPRGPTRGVDLVATAAGGGGALGSGPRGPQADTAPHSPWEDCRGAKTLESGAKER